MYFISLFPESCTSFFMLFIHVSPFLSNSLLLSILIARGFGLVFPSLYCSYVVVTWWLVSEKKSTVVVIFVSGILSPFESMIAEFV